MMKKRGLILLAATLAGVVLSASCFASGFEAKNQYADGTFTDVANTEWYATEVKSAYELGFMNGVGANLFSPDGKVTVAEAVTMASRVHASYNGKTIENAEGEWYQMYVNYAIANGIIEEGQFDSYDRNIKRYEMAVVFHNSVPAEWLNKVNNVDYLTDVNEKADYRDEILNLYNSGVVMGNDAYGTFYPNNEIIRCEAAAIINRVAIPSNRLQKTLEKREAPVPAMYFIDDTGGMSMNVYGQYGWEFDQRGGPAGAPADVVYVIDTSKTERSAMLRTFAEHGTGKITMEMNVEATLATNGLSFILNMDEQKNAMHFVTKNGTFHAVEGDKLIDTGAAVPKNFYIKTITDMEAKTNTLIIDGKLIGTYGFDDADCTSVNTLTICSTKEDEVIAKVSKTKLYTGYALNDIFLGFTNRAELPYNWKLEGGATGKLSYLQSNSYDFLSAEIIAPANTNNVLSTTFDPITRKVCFEMKFRMVDYVDGTKFALTSGGNEIVSISTKGDSYYDANGNFLKKYNSNVWQSIRFEANTDTGVVDYKINYKKVGTGYFNAASFDGISVTLPATKEVSMMLDDFLVYNLFDEEPDYVPEPVPVESDEAIVGIEVCDIWRNGFQHGWDYTSAYDELYTYLGMFDEGSTEVADWETKWLVEHGVDFKLVCWYSGTPSQPIKTPRNSYGLMAQLNSKYSEQMKYAIMWENAGNNPGSSEQFRKNIVDYWVEYHLSDKDRYFTIDNKPLITIYQSSKLIDVFGSVEAVKAELDYLRQVCVDLGYDGAIILTTGTPSENVYKMGFDGIYAYNWGQNAFNPEYQKNTIKSQDEKAKAAGITSVPTVGVGFCNMFLGQGNSRSPLITPEDLESVLNWATDEFLKDRTGEPWQTNMVILSNWNEFGEGHYILPTNRIGFTYLDAIRNAFCSAEPEHTDLRPDDETRARYNALYDQKRKRIRRYELEEEDADLDISTLTSLVKWDFTQKDTEEIFRNSHGTTVEYTGNSVKGKSQGADFAIITTKDLLFNASDAEYLRIVYKATAATETTNGQFYFITKADGTWNEKKNVDFEIKADGEYHEYIVNLTKCPAWKGVITRVRFDPITRGDCEWEIKEFEFLDAPSTYEIYVNGFATPTPTVFSPVYENGVLAAAIDPYADKFYAKLGIFYRWDYEKQQLSLYGLDDKYIIFTMGCSTAQTSDGEVMLGVSPRLVDGIPMIEIDSMASALGLNLVIEDGKYNISHKNIGSLEGGTASDIVWDFNTSGYADGFVMACAEVLDHEDGKISFKSTSNGRRHDPVMNSPTISYDAVKYEKIVVGFSYDLTDGYGEATGITSSVFFAPPNGTFNGTDVVQVKTEGLSSNGKTIEVEFDMTSNDNYAGTIGKIRFDPFEAEGTFTVDYIKIVLTNPEGKIKVKERAKEFTWKPGDATPEGTVFTAENGNMSVVNNPINESEKVFKMTATAKSRSWAYFNVYMNFEPGATYQVNFKLYGIETATGEKYTDCAMGGNFMYGSDGNNVSNHAFGPGSVKYGEWVNVTKTVTIPEDYVPSNKDRFQIWSNPTNNIATGYLVSDIKVVKVS